MKFKKTVSKKWHKGHKVFKINQETLEITEVQLSTLPIKNGDGTVNKNRKIVTEEGFYYMTALNKKNVVRRLKNLGIEIQN